MTFPLPGMRQVAEVFFVLFFVDEMPEKWIENFKGGILCIGVWQKWTREIRTRNMNIKVEKAR